VPQPSPKLTEEERRRKMLAEVKDLVNKVDKLETELAEEPNKNKKETPYDRQFRFSKLGAVGHS